MKYEIRAMSFGEIIDTGFRLTRDHFVLLVGMSAVLNLPLALFGEFFKLVQPGPMGGAAEPGGATAVVILVGVGVMLLFVAVASPLVSGAVTHAVGELYLDRPSAMGSSMRHAWGIFLPMLGTMFLWVGMIFLGTLLLIIPGIYLAFCYTLIWPIMVLEGVFGMAALRRSRSLMKGNIRRVLGVVMVAGILVSLLGQGVELLLSWIPVAGAVAVGIVRSAGGAFTTAVLVVIYFEVRSRKESFDLEHLAQLVERQAPRIITA